MMVDCDDGNFGFWFGLCHHPTQIREGICSVVPQITPDLLGTLVLPPARRKVHTSVTLHFQEHGHALVPPTWRSPRDRVTGRLLTHQALFGDTRPWMIVFFLSFFFNLFIFWPHGTWNLSSPTRDWTRTPSLEVWSLNHWTTREVLFCFFFPGMIGLFFSFWTFYFVFGYSQLTMLW